MNDIFFFVQLHMQCVMHVVLEPKGLSVCKLEVAVINAKSNIYRQSWQVVLCVNINMYVK